MARTKKNNGDGGSPVSSFQHGGAARLNIPEATETQAGLSKGKKRVYRYSPHLSPKLQFDPTGKSDQVLAIVEKVLAGQKLTDDEADILRSLGQQVSQPWLEWAAKQEQQTKGSFAVDDVEKEVAKFTVKGVNVLLSGRFQGGGGGDYLDLEVGGIVLSLFQGQ